MIRRALVYMATMSLALMGAGSLAVIGAPAAAAADDTNATFCQARVDAEKAFGQEDQQAAQDAVQRLQDNAPSEIATEVSTLANLLSTKGPAAFEDPAGAAAAQTADTWVLEHCGFERVDVTGVDYKFEGIPKKVPSGVAAFNFTNQSKDEDHEMVILRVNDNVHASAKKLLSMPEKKIQKKATFVGAAQAQPGQSQVTLPDLESGRYVVACFVNTGGEKHGKPHWMRGMYDTFTVT